jgi:hypothetical protein
LVATVTDTTTGGTFFTSAPSNGYSRFETNLGDGGPDRAYFGTIGILDDTKPVVGFSDLSSNVYLCSQLHPTGGLQAVASVSRP